MFDNNFSTEQVSRWHPDKACDQVSDAILTEYLRLDENAHCGIETLWKGNTIVLGGEIGSTAEVDREMIARAVARELGYTDVSGEVKVIDLISEQSAQICDAVNADENIGAGDQGMMYGYACRETKSMLPFGFDIANRIIRLIEEEKNLYGRDSIFKGDAKCQVTVDRGAEGLDSLRTIVISACHAEDQSIHTVREYIRLMLKRAIPMPGDVELIINPAGAWTFGGPYADCGLTGRKIVCDQYGGYCPVGGGAFSGKDPSKVDRSAAYMARYLACKALEDFRELDECQIQLAYAIGRSRPVGVEVKTNDDYLSQVISRRIQADYDLSPKGIIDFLDLKHKDYGYIARGCHYRPDGILEGIEI